MASTTSLRSSVREFLTSVYSALNVPKDQLLGILIFDSLPECILGFDIEAPCPRFSNLCWDGTPIEYAISLEEGHLRFGYIIDCSVLGFTTRNNYDLQVGVTQKMLQLIGADHCIQIERCLRSILFPPNERLQVRHGSLMYHYVYLTNPPLLKVIYPLGETVSALSNQLARIVLTLSLNQPAQRLQEAFDIIKYQARPFAVAVEYLHESIRRVKVYARGDAMPVSVLFELVTRLGLQDHFWAIDEMSDAVIGASTLPANAYDLSFDLYSPSQTDLPIKVDYALHRFTDNDEHARHIVLLLADSLGLDASCYRTIDGLLANTSSSCAAVDRHTFIGIGLKLKTRPRLGVYIKPGRRLMHFI